MKSWKGSDVEFAIELAVHSVSDGEITPTEMKEIVREISARWLPAIAADKVRKYVTADTVPSELKAAEVLAKVVNNEDNKDAAIATVKTILKNG
jgi:ABC-type Zn uptake system ZnuABC Zn-binding protein ZnuA